MNNQNEEEFNPFEILPKPVMLRVLAHAFEKDARGDFSNFMDYKTVSKELRQILSDENSFNAIMNTMPTEFNIALIHSLKHRKVTSKEGRYRAGVALLFLKHLYENVKPHANDQYLQEHFDYYYKALEDIYEKFNDYPMVVYINAFVSFQIAKRLLTTRLESDELRIKGGKLYKICADSIVRAAELEHPIAKIFHDDMSLQLVRNGVKIKNWVKEIPKSKNLKLTDIEGVLSPKKKVDLSSYSDEDQDMLTITWQKLIIEDCYNSQRLFAFALDHDLLMRITEYFYECFAINHFHRVALAFNPIFKHSNCTDNILWLFKKYKVKTLVNLHQGFRIFYPQPDSVLLSVLLTSSLDELKSVQASIDNLLTLPQQGMQGWKTNFIDAYRDAIDDGSLKNVSFEQMRMVMNYFCLVNRAGLIGLIMERDAFLLSKVFHCSDDKMHRIASSIVSEVSRLSTFDPLGHLEHQEILLSCLYDDPDILIPVEMKDDSDYDKLAKVIIQSYKNIIAAKLTAQPEIIVPDFIRSNPTQFNDLKVDLHDKFQSMGYLKAA